MQSLKDLVAPRIQSPPATPDAPDAPPADAPLERVTDVADTTSNALVGFIDWVTSGERDALVALAATLALIAMFYAIRQGILMLLPKLPERDRHSVSALLKRLVRRIRSYFIIVAALWIAERTFGFPDAVAAGIEILFVLAAVIQVAELVQEVVVSLIKRSALRNPGDAATLASAVNILKWLASVVIWSVALLLVLDNIGADVTALVAGLGIGGIAIGLAAQGIFQDLFSALSIIFDRPFQRGDFITYGDTLGEIEDIGLKTTRIRSLDGEQIIISNTNLLDLEIHNLARMPKRRVVTGFGLIYGTDPDLAERAIEVASEIVRDTPGAEFDRCNMIGFGASSLDYELIFHSLNPDYKRARALTSKILLKIFRRFREEGMDFAFPTQTLHIASLPDGLSDEIAAALAASVERAGMKDAA